MRKSGVAALGLVVLLAGCGGNASNKQHHVDKTALIADMHAQGYEGASMSGIDKYIKTMRKTACGNDEEQTELTIAITIDNGDADTLDATRTAIKYICPEDLTTWDHARAEVDSLG